MSQKGIFNVFEMCQIRKYSSAICLWLLNRRKCQYSLDTFLRSTKLREEEAKQKQHLSESRQDEEPKHLLSTRSNVKPEHDEAKNP